MATKSNDDIENNRNDNVTESTPLISNVGADSEASTSGTNPQNGLPVAKDFLLIAGGMLGSEFLTLPRALVLTGWTGVPIIILAGVIAAFNAKLLGLCWTTLVGVNPELRNQQHHFYAIITDAALGRKWSEIVSTLITVTVLGTCVAYLLMAAQITEEIFLTLLPSMTYCWWYLIVVCVIIPFICFDSSKFFSLSSRLALGAICVACVLYLIQMINDIRPGHIFRWGIHGFLDFFSAIGIIMFAFGRASSFRVVKADVAAKNSRYTNQVHSFYTALSLYLVMAISGYAIYGESVASLLPLSLAPTSLTFAGNVLMAGHLILVVVINSNTVFHELDELFNVSRDSKVLRIIIRCCTVFFILFVGESIPRFNTVISLIGGSSVALLTFVLPPYCYLKITSNTPPAARLPGCNIVDEISGKETLCWCIVALGTFVGFAASFSAITAVFSTAQVMPCYFR